MASVNSREQVDEIIAANGRDGVVKIVQYNNMFDGGLTYGLVFKTDGKRGYNRYEESLACGNAKILWEKQA